MNLEKTDSHVIIYLEERLDAFWAKTAQQEFDELLRDDHHHLELNLEKSTFLSSAGIRIFLMLYKKVKKLNGTLYLSDVAPSIRKVFEMSGLSVLLEAPQASHKGSSGSNEEEALIFDNVLFEKFPVENANNMEGRVIGNPSLMSSNGYGEKDVHSIKLKSEQILLGTGSCGSDWNECKDSFGELIALKHVTAFLPTDGKETADFMVGNEGFEPEIQLLYGLKADGKLSHFTRFKAKDKNTQIGLSEIAESTLKWLDKDHAVLVMLAESAGLSGVSLKKSPVYLSKDEPALEFPSTRKWFNLTPEKTYIRNLALVIGFVSKKPPAIIEDAMRPLSEQSEIMAHFHAAPFSYRVFKTGKLDLNECLGELFESESLHDVLHLINDNRPVVGIGESQFRSGAIWAGGINWKRTS